MKVCIIGASGKLGKYLVQHALDKRYNVVGVCREQSVEKLEEFKDRITVIPGAKNDPEDINDQVEACRRVFASDRRWTVIRGSDLEEGDSQGLPVWSRHVGDPILKSNITRRVDFALFMVEALTNDELIHKAPAIVSCRSPSALAHTVNKRSQARP